MNSNILDSIKPSIRLEQRYYKALLNMIREINKDVKERVLKPYRKMAFDSKTSYFEHAIDVIVGEWEHKSIGIAEQLALAMFTQVDSNYTKRLNGAFRKHGMEIPFKLSIVEEEIARASVAMNTALIRSIANQYLEKVQLTIWESVGAGLDAHMLSKNLQHNFGVVERRARNIARDQTAKITETIERVRFEEAGIEEAIWLHSGAGKEPRPSHVKANGKRYKLSEGLLIDGEYIHPSQEINCHLGTSNITSLSGLNKLWRRRYRGELAKIVTGNGLVLEATPNHPILTDRGWIAINAINKGDKIVNASFYSINRITSKVNSSVATFSEIFDSSSFLVGSVSTGIGASFNFHGDTSDYEVDTIDTALDLPIEVDPFIYKDILNLFFEKSNHLFMGVSGNSSYSFTNLLKTLLLPSDSMISFFSDFLSLLKGGFGESVDIRFALVSNLNVAIEETLSDNISTNAEFIRESFFAHSSGIKFDDFLARQVFKMLALPIWCDKSSRPYPFTNGSGVVVENLGNFIEGQSVIEYKFDSVIDISRSFFDGHVYNLHNLDNWYVTDNIITHNCRCTKSAVLPFKRVK